ncbi:DNA polymerase kappa isoform X2 [Callorhinchus milii]|uniref:DNA polymerase kappa isoform X2 n=1 Tax=Callorhinchus milii TaxID=7868 RepID=UPI0004571408|nr:DNA polymerase kappa isoform X2 [Callorhinchus milii]|eukprot:gi/632974207/ref/XP_007903546.1/ PREDICTED: DNA polymerase kappa isoform X2 [Callorhinchus milii]
MAHAANKNADKSAPSESILSGIALNDNKAGMEGLDKEKINKIILEASKGSKFYENELKKEQQVNHRIDKMLQQKAQITEQQLRKAQYQVEQLAADLEKRRDMSRTIVHIDMDAFYAAVEIRDNPELKDKPIGVGSTSMLVQEILADYDPNFFPISLDEAYLDITEHLEQRQNWPEHKRTYYCHSESDTQEEESPGDLQPSFEDLEGISPVLFEDSPPVLQQGDSVHCENQQEGCCIEGSKKESNKQQKEKIVFGVSVEETVREMRFRIEQKTKLTASAGIAPNTMLSKVCSDMKKPNGQYRIPFDSEAVMGFIKNLPIRKVPGIGKVTEKLLNALGITKCTELYQQGALLSLLFSETSWHHFLEISLGLGGTHLERDGERKSMSIERTFNEICKAEEQYSLCRDLCSDLAEDLHKNGLRGKTVTIKLKNVHFDVKTRACTVPVPVSTEEKIFAVAYKLLKTEIDSLHPQPLRLRLMGIKVSGFVQQEVKRSCQKSIINFFHGGIPERSPESESKEIKTQVEIPQTSGAESFFNKKRAMWQQNNQEAFFKRVLANRHQETCKTAVTMPVGSVDEMQSDGGLTAEMKITSNCPICFKMQSVPNLEAFNKHIDECLSTSIVEENLPPSVIEIADEMIISKTSSAFMKEGSVLDNNLRKKNLINLKSYHLNKEQKGKKCSKKSSKMSPNIIEDVLETEAENSNYCRASLIESSTYCIGESVQQTDVTETLNDHIALPDYTAKSLEVGKDSNAFEREFSNHNLSCTKEPLKSSKSTQLEEIYDQQNVSCNILEHSLSVQHNQLRPRTQYVEQSSQTISKMSKKKHSIQVGEATALVCPVCNVEQAKTDLSAFNQHVDICLNQGVIQELIERQAHPSNTYNVSNRNIVGLSGFEKPSSNSMTRIKRMGSSAQKPASKKARFNNSKLTIDNFFK